MQLQGIGEKELLVKIGEAMELLHNIFGYTVEFHDKYDVEANVKPAMEHVHNFATILFHFLNDLGEQIMESTVADTIYVLGADEKLRELHNVDDYKYRGHVFLPESLGDEDESELKKVYLGSKIVPGAIAHEVSHELDRRAGKLSSASEGGEPPPVGSLEWFLWNKVQNRLQPTSQYGYNFRMAASYLNPGSRAARIEDYDSDREIFADIMPAKILGPMKKGYSPRADTAAEIGFNATSNAKDTACGIEQYYDQYAHYLEHKTPEPKDFVYDPELCESEKIR